MPHPRDLADLDTLTHLSDGVRERLRSYGALQPDWVPGGIPIAPAAIHRAAQLLDLLYEGNISAFSAPGFDGSVEVEGDRFVVDVAADGSMTAYDLRDNVSDDEGTKKIATDESLNDVVEWLRSIR